MDPLFMAISLFRRRRFEECVKICSDILESNPYDQVSIVIGLLIILFIQLHELHSNNSVFFLPLPLARRPGS